MPLDFAISALLTLFVVVDKERIRRRRSIAFAENSPAH
jgi:hypothetical protein